ncbi:MAG: hypothetical protein IKN69_00770 [Bacilli bacterium]|nr:hypothetical protein [Bacilli bacterium]
MKRFNKLVSLSSLLFMMALASCGNTPATSSKAPESSEPEEDPNAVSVFVLSGQSNMEGNTSFKSGSTDLIAQAFEEMGLEDPEILTETGVESVQTSLYCAGYGQLDHTKLDTNTQVNSTNKTERFKGEFVPTKTGLGLNSSKMGPELGMAYALKDEATAEKPIYFIKMASGGSGFEQAQTQYNWPVKDAEGNWPEINMYHTFCKPFIENNLKLIEDAGWKPVIKGWLWHQGESDSATEKIAKYKQRLGDMVELFRTDFAPYAKEEDGENIAFVDGMIYQGSGTAWGAQTSKDMNAVKQEFADSADNNYIVDIYANEEAIPENELKPGTPGGDNMHYNVKSSLRLGMGYAKVILDNNLLD